MKHSYLTVLVLVLGMVSFSWCQISQIQPRMCVCPGFSRQVCSFGPSGNVEFYDNLCFAKCDSEQSGRGFAIRPRFECRQLNTPGVVGVAGPGGNSNITEEQYLDLWVRDVRGEAEIYKKANALVSKLVELANVPNASPCVCPGIIRPIYLFGPAGNVIKFNNICHLKCEVLRSGRNTFAVNPVPPKQFSGSSTNSDRVDEERDALALKEWTEAMEKEIQFYSQVQEAMKGLFE